MIKDNSKERGRALVNWLGCVILVFCCGAAGNALAQAFPARPIRIILPFGAGGVSDITARLLAQRLTDSMRQQFIIENRPGAGGIVATEIAMRAEPDGYTLFWLASSHAVSVSLMKSLPYDPVRDFAPVSTVAFYPLALLVNADSPIKSVSGMIASAKANPGKFNIGTLWIGTTNNLSAELFKIMAGLDTQLVPFKSTPALIAAATSNEVQAIFEFIAPALPHVKSGGLRALGVTSERRFVGLPDVPTLAEAGLPGFEATAWNAVAVPVKTPKVIIDRLNKEFNAVLNTREMKQRLLELGIDARASAPEGLRELLASEIVKWKAVIEKAKIERQ